jgi:hypothetical protein
VPTGARKLAAILAAATLAASMAAAAATPAAVRNYDLGEIALPDPGPKGPLPVRLWGAIGAPRGPGPHPLVVVAHGRHGDNCPVAPGDSFEWPCFAREQRNDLGLRHLVAALERRGVAAIAPDLNGAYTIGWGEPSDERRWPRIVNRTLFELAVDAVQGGNRFGLRVERRIDFSRIGLLGHSRSGHNAVRLARGRASHDQARQIGAGQGPVESLFLLAPAFEGAQLPDLETAIVASRCDGDVPGEARDYLERARRDRREEPVLFVRLEGANHNFYNRTLSELGRDDGNFAGVTRCRKRDRLGPGAQQRWIDAIARNFFATTLRGRPRPAWMKPRHPEPGRLHGLPVAVERLAR